MKKIKVGIVGYGNLGKAVETTILSDTRYKLVAIFSRRLVVSKYNTPVESYYNFKNYINKIDVMLLCGGSKSDLEQQTPEVAEFFDCINTFDTHCKISSELNTLDTLAKKSKHRVIIACGWDPGLFSVMRATFYSLSKCIPETFWGKGVSMGHSDAIRKIEHVQDAIQFTIPNKKAIELCKKNQLPADVQKHFRECYVVCEKKYQNTIESKIKSMPNYFKNQPTTVHFISQTQISKLKQNMSHKGQVISSFSKPDGEKFKLDFSVAMTSNPSFTSSIMISYINAIMSLKSNKQYGAFTCLDIPVSYLFYNWKREDIINKFC